MSHRSRYSPDALTTALQACLLDLERVEQVLGKAPATQKHIIICVIVTNVKDLLTTTLHLARLANNNPQKK